VVDLNLRKPFTPRRLIEKIREILDRPPAHQHLVDPTENGDNV
jgi:DNA-binding response OmpR family regulator